MLKNRLPRDYKGNQIFRLELSAEQMNYIAHQLPFGYSLVLQPKKSLPKHVIQATKRKQFNQSQDSNSYVQNQSKTEQANVKKGTVLTPANLKSNLQKLGAQKAQSNTNLNVSNKWMQSLNQGLKKAAKILTLLRAHKSSWPFQEPVDALALDIPQYYQIIKQPMDLSTIQNKLKTQKYTQFNEFQNDVMKIIQNSYRFNEANQDFLKITSQFQNYFIKLTTDTAQDTKNSNKNNKKKKKSNTANRQFNDSIPVTLLQKKQLAQQIRRLGKQHLKGIKNIVFDHPQQQQDVFDLQKLTQKKLRELQKYVRSRIIAMQQRNRNLQSEKVQLSNLNLYQSDQSPFQTDSSIEA